MNFEGPVLSLQPTSFSSKSPLPSFHVQSDPSTQAETTLYARMSSSENHLKIIAKPRSCSIGDIKSTPNSPILKHTSFLDKRSSDDAQSRNTLSPFVDRRFNSMPRVHRANSAEPGTIQASPKISRFMKRAPTIDTPDITKKEFEDYIQLNQYRMFEIIGQGSYGIVRKATDDNDEVYAMKILNKKKLLRKGFVGRARPGMKPRSSPRENIEREIAILKKLDHPNVVRLFEVLDDPQEVDLILVFEYIQKGPVIDKLPMDERFSEGKSRDYFIDLMLGLEYLHSQHVIHRDIKPQNLLLDDLDRIKIADFGVSEQIERSETNISRWAGTPAFVAPETLSSSNSFKGQAVDIWAAGITLFCFAFGKVPWSPPSIPELYEMIKNDDVPFPEDDVSVSKDLLDLLKKLLNKDPEGRITLSELRMHPWVQNTTTIIPSKEENCQEEIGISEEDIKEAIKPFNTPIHILFMIKQMALRRSLRNPKTYSRGDSYSCGDSYSRGGSCSPAASAHTSPRHTPTSPTEKSNEPCTNVLPGKPDKFEETQNAPSIVIESNVN